MFNFNKPKPKASDESAEMKNIFNYRWLDESFASSKNGGFDNSRRNSSFREANIQSGNYVVTKKPKIYGAQDSRQIRRLLDFEECQKAPPLLKISKQHEVIPSYGEMDFFLKADLKRDVGTPDRNRQQGLRDSRGVADLISSRYRGESPKQTTERRPQGKRVGQTNLMTSSQNVSEILGQVDVNSQRGGCQYMNRQDTGGSGSSSVRSLPHHSQLPPISPSKN